MSSKKNNKTKKSNKSNENVKNKLSINSKENIIIGLGLILFIVIISIVVYYVIRTNNPDSFKTEQELYEDMLANMISEYNESQMAEEEDKTKNDGTFSVLVDNILLEGKLPKTMKSKYYIECYKNGLINIYSKYTYALSQTKYNEPKGIVLQIMLATDDILKAIEEEGDKYTVITKIKDYSIIYIIPDDIQYLEEDDISRSNYDKLAKYRDEIIKSVTVKDITEEENKSNVI